MPSPYPVARQRWTFNPAPRPPHPSWARPAEPAERAPVSAADFWHRLGL